jgi:hypothetical protein
MQDAESDDAQAARRQRAVLGAKSYADLFRQAAAKFHSDLDVLQEDELKTECGRLIIEADELGYLPEHSERRQLVEWHTGDSSNDRQPGMPAVRGRCPANLFDDIAGGHQVGAKQVDGKWTLVEGPHGTPLCGGLLPEDIPATLRMTRSERYAFTCDWHADLIEQRVNTSGVMPTIQVTLDRAARLTEATQKILKAIRDSKQGLTQGEIVSCSD